MPRYDMTTGTETKETAMLISRLDKIPRLFFSMDLREPT
jgi:hypothetical protein